jgi:hypothetical protein
MIPCFLVPFFAALEFICFACSKAVASYFSFGSLMHELLLAFVSSFVHSCRLQYDLNPEILLLGFTCSSHGSRDCKIIVHFEITEMEG